MYYEEKLINGIVHFRTSENGEFKPHTLESLSTRYEIQRENFVKLSTQLTKEIAFRNHINIISSNFHMIKEFELKEEA